MTRHWWNERKQEKRWKSKIFINGSGLVLTAFILSSVLIIKFHAGGWITILITGSVVIVSMLVKRFYYKTRMMLLSLDKLAHVSHNEAFVAGQIGENKILSFNPEGRTAVIMVNGFNGMGLHTLFNVLRIFKGGFKNFFFIEAGIVDAGNFKGVSEVESLKQHVKVELDKYVGFMRKHGFYAEGFSAVGTDSVNELDGLAQDLFRKYPQSIFFGGQIVFPEETIMTKLFYNHATFAIQRRLHQQGIPFFIMPIRVKKE